MRNKLLFTAAIICAGMTPFGVVHTRAQADDGGGAFEAYGINDGAVNAAYDAYGNVSSTDGSNTLSAVIQSITDNTAVEHHWGGLVLGVGESRPINAVVPDIYNTEDFLFGARSRPGEKFDSLFSNSSASQVDLGSNALQISYNPVSSVFAGCIHETDTTCGKSEATATPTLAQLQTFGWLYLGTDGYNSPDTKISNQVSITRTDYPQNVLTLTNPGNNYNGHTILRGRSALILANGGGLTSEGMVEIGLGSNSAASLIVDGAGSKLNLYDGGQSSESLPNSLIGSLVVGNNDPTLSLSYKDTAPPELTNKLIVENGGTVNARTISVANSNAVNNATLGATPGQVNGYEQALGGVIYVTGKGSSLTAGDGGLTVNGGRGSIVVDHGGTITSNGAIALGDAQPASNLSGLQNTTQVNDYDTVQGKLIIGQGGTLYAGDSLVTLRTNDGSASNYQYAIISRQTYTINGVKYPLVDGISENFNQAGLLTSIVTNNGNSSFSILDGTLANRNNTPGSQEYTAYGSVAALHTNMDIGIGGTATFDVTDTSGSPDSLAAGGGSKTGMVIGGNITDYTNSATGKLTQGSLQKTGTGTLALLGQNSYGGSTIVGSGTLQLGGVIGRNKILKSGTVLWQDASGQKTILQSDAILGNGTVYGQRLFARTVAESSDAVGFKKGENASQLISSEVEFIEQAAAQKGKTVSSNDLQSLLLSLLSNPNDISVTKFALDLGEFLAQNPAYQAALQGAYLNAGTLSSQSAVQLYKDSTLNLAWGLETEDVNEQGLAGQNSQTIANNISGYGQIARDLQDGNDADSAIGSPALDDVTSTIHLTGQVNLGRAADDTSSTPALLVRKGYLSVDNGGAVNIYGGRNIVVGSNQGGDNNQLFVQNGGAVTNYGGNMIIGGDDETGSDGNSIHTNNAVGYVTVDNGGSDGRGAVINLVHQNGAGGNAVIGGQGTGTLAIGPGGAFNTYDGDLTVGRDVGSNGYVTVTNGTQANATASLIAYRAQGSTSGGNVIVGKAGTGTLRIGTQTQGYDSSTTEGGNVVLGGNLTLGDEVASSGTVWVGNYTQISPSITSHLDLIGSGNTGNITVGHEGYGLLAIYSGAEATAYGASVGADSQLNVGAANPNGAHLYGGQLFLGGNGLTVNAKGAAGAARGGVISSLGQVDVKASGTLSVGDNVKVDDSNPANQGRLIVGDSTKSPGINIDQSATAVLYANGVIQNYDTAGFSANLTIGSDNGGKLKLDDKGDDQSEKQHGTFDVTPNHNIYVTSGLVNNGTAIGGLTKDGQGTLYLEAAVNGYTGKTFVKEGTLAIAGAQDPSADVRSSSNNTSSLGIEVNNGATLTGNTNDSGAAAATIVDAGGTVEANWNYYTGQLNIGKAGDPDTGQTLTMTDASSVLSVGANNQSFTPAASGDQAKNIDLTGKALVGYDKAAGSNSDTKTFNSSYMRLNSGVINVNGSAALGNATLNIQVSAMPTDENQGYRILNATGGVRASQSGEHSSAGYYNTLTGNLTTMPYLSPYLVFEEKAVDVIMQRNNASFGAPGQTRNERETGHGLDGMGNSLLAHAMMGMGTDSDARRALNNLSGEIHASARSALIQDSYLLEQGMVDRMEDFGCDGDDRVSSHGRYDLHTHRKESRCYDDHAILWGQAYGSMGHNAGDGNASMLHHQTTGFIMGVDTPVDDHWRVGGMLAYGRSMFNSDGATNSSGNSNNISIGTYAGRHWGRLNLRLGGFYTWNLMNMNRRVQVGSFGGRQTSHYRNGTARVFGELGYKMNYKKVEFEPFAGLSYVNQYGGSFREHGVAALYSKGQDDGVLFSSFGVRAVRNFRIGKMRLRAHAMGAYRHAFGGIVSSRQQQLIGSTNDMSIGGVPLSSNSAIIKTGVSAKLSDRIDVDLSYIGQYGNQSIESGATGSVRFEF